MLRVAIVHYHLQRGGVTRVIESALRGLDQNHQPIHCAVFAGEVPSDFNFQQQAVTIQGLHYSNAQAHTPSPQALLAELQHAARLHFGAPPDLWHIHNHSLGKNTALPELVARLAEQGAALLLQMHDFAEDGRPENYRSIPETLRLYPNSPHVHYAVLNARDHAFIRGMGVPPERLHLLPNPVEGPTTTPRVNAHSPTPPQSPTAKYAPEAEALPTQQPEANPIRSALHAKRLFLYPVRAVRRKNFGEMLLWAALAPIGDVFATTLGPTNLNYIAPYERWKTFAASLDLPVHFAIGETHDWPFDSMIQAASAILNTSIAEGFGLAFLEPWLFGKSIVGRDLPQITADFKAAGIDLDRLYPALAIPKAWIDLDALRAAIESKLNHAYAAYQIALPSDACERALAAITLPEDHLDFGGLDENQQKQIIERVRRDPTAHQAMKQKLEISIEQITTNADRIQQHYGLTHYATTLEGMYRHLQQAPIGPVNFFDGTQLLNAFLTPENFRLLRT